MKSSRSKFFKVFQQDYCLPENVNISFLNFSTQKSVLIVHSCTPLHFNHSHFYYFTYMHKETWSKKYIQPESVFFLWVFFSPFPNRSQMLPTSILAKISPLAHTLIHSLTHTHTDTHSYTHSLTHTETHTQSVSHFNFSFCVCSSHWAWASILHFLSSFKQWSLLLTHPPQMWTIVVVAFLFSFLLLPLLLLIRT